MPWSRRLERNSRQRGRRKRVLGHGSVDRFQRPGVNRTFPRSLGREQVGERRDRDGRETGTKLLSMGEDVVDTTSKDVVT